MDTIKIKINTKKYMFLVHELMNSKSELLRTTYNNIKNNTFSDNACLTLLYPNNREIYHIDDIISYLKDTTFAENYYKNLEVTIDNLSKIIDDFFIAKILIIPELAKVLQNKISDFLIVENDKSKSYLLNNEKYEINLEDNYFNESSKLIKNVLNYKQFIEYQNKIEIVENAGNYTYKYCSSDVTYFKIYYSNNVYCVTIGDYDKFIFEKKISKQGYYVYDTLYGKPTFKECSLDTIYNVFKEKAIESILFKLYLVTKKYNLLNYNQIESDIKNAIDFNSELTFTSIKDFTLELLNLFDFSKNIIFQINEILSYSDSIRFSLYKAIEDNFDKEMLFKHTFVNKKSKYSDTVNKDIFNIKKSFLKRELLLNIKKFNNIAKKYITENIVLIGDKIKENIVEESEYDYVIHDNYDKPFLVKILNNEIIVYGIPNKNKITLNIKDNDYTEESCNDSDSGSDNCEEEKKEEEKEEEEEDVDSDIDMSSVISYSSSHSSSGKRLKTYKFKITKEIIDEKLKYIEENEKTLFNILNKNIKYGKEITKERKNIKWIERTIYDRIIKTENQNQIKFNNSNYISLMKITHFKKILIGEEANDVSDNGNNILVKISEGRYLYFGSGIEILNINDEIINFQSEIGNNDVPYSYAISTNYTYLTSEYLYVKNDILCKKNPYDYYYDHSNRNYEKSLKGKCLKKKDFLKFNGEVVVPRFYYRNDNQRIFL